MRRRLLRFKPRPVPFASIPFVDPGIPPPAPLGTKRPRCNRPRGSCLISRAAPHRLSAVPGDAPCCLAPVRYAESVLRYFPVGDVPFPVPPRLCDSVTLWPVRRKRRHRSHRGSTRLPEGLHDRRRSTGGLPPPPSSRKGDFARGHLVKTKRQALNLTLAFTRLNFMAGCSQFPWPLTPHRWRNRSWQVGGRTVTPVTEVRFASRI